MCGAEQVWHADAVGQGAGAPDVQAVFKNLDLYVGRVAIVAVADGVDQRLAQGHQGVIPYLLPGGCAGDFNAHMQVLLHEGHGFFHLLNHGARDDAVVHDVYELLQAACMHHGLRQWGLWVVAKQQDGGTGDGGVGLHQLQLLQHLPGVVVFSKVAPPVLCGAAHVAAHGIQIEVGTGFAGLYQCIHALASAGEVHGSDFCGLHHPRGAACAAVAAASGGDGLQRHLTDLQRHHLVRAHGHAVGGGHHDGFCGRGNPVDVVAQGFFAKACAGDVGVVTHTDQDSATMGVGKGHGGFNHVGAKLLFELKGFPLASAQQGLDGFCRQHLVTPIRPSPRARARCGLA